MDDTALEAALPRMRATAVAIFGMAFGLIGMGLGPTFLGFASDKITRASFTMGRFEELCPGGRASPNATADLAHACQQASVTGIRWALASIAVAFVWAAVRFLLASRTLARDVTTHRPRVRSTSAER